MLKSLSRPLAALMLLALAALPARAQVAVLTIQSIDDVLSTVKYVATLAGKGEQANQLDGIIQALTGGKGFAGMDTKRPLGAFALLPNKPNSPPAAMAFLPISKEQDFLDFLRGIGFEATKGEGNAYQFMAPTGQQVFFRFANQYAYFTDQAAHLSGSLPDPSRFPALAGAGNLITAMVDLEKIPPEFKQQFLAEMHKNIDREKARKPGEDDVAYQARLAGMNATVEAFKGLVDGSKAVTLALNVDQKAGKFTADLALAAKGGTGLAKHLQSLGAARSSFAAVGKDAAISFLAKVSLPEELRQTLVGLVEKGVAEGLKKETDPQKKAIGEKVYAAIKPSLTKLDALDFGGALRGPYQGDKYVGILAVKVAEGKGIENLVRDLVKQLPPSDKVTVQLDKEMVGGVAIHLIQGKSGDKEAQRIFGAEDVYLAFRDDAVIAAIGQNGLAVMKEVLGSGSGTATAPVQFDMSLAKAAALSPDNSEKVREAMKKVFSGAGQGKDTIRFRMTGGDSLKLHFEMDAQIVKLAEILAP